MSFARVARFRRWLPVLLLALFLPGCEPAPPAGGSIALLHAEAAIDSWQAEAPPVHGWVKVTLPHLWSDRWPEHDGVVWYRLRWQQGGPGPVALLIDQATMASALQVNGSLVARDASLVEPLSRGWMQPRYVLVDAPLLRAGENELIARVSGYAAYRPGFGSVYIGEPESIAAQYRQRLYGRLHLHVADIAARVTLVALFAMLWLMRRRDPVYGWFAAAQALGAIYPLYFLVPGPWPFAQLHSLQAWIAALWVCAGAGQTMFLLRFAEVRLPIAERTLGLISLAALLCAWLVPAWMGPQRDGWVLVGTVLYFGGLGWFVAHALRAGSREQRVMAVCLLPPLFASVHDFGIYMGWMPGHSWLLSWTSLLTLFGIAFVLSHRFASASRRVEQFNAELQHEVDEATTQLSETLRREHDAALAHERADARLRLVRDLHDGFGGTLVAAIHRLRNAPQTVSAEEIVDVLRRMRDDLRLVVDTTAGDNDELGALLANLRHRAESLLEGVGIETAWRLEGVDGLSLGGARNLDLLRLLQEALTNAGRHSGARRVRVRVAREGEQLQVQVSDDGRGITGAPGAAAGGMGVASMRLRAARLGGELRIETGATGTTLRLAFPLPEAAALPVSGASTPTAPA